MQQTPTCFNDAVILQLVENLISALEWFIHARVDRADYTGDLVHFGKYCFSCPSIAKCIQEKYWVGEKGFELFWVQLGNRFFFFFQGQCAIMELCCSLWLPVHWQHAHTPHHTCMRCGSVEMWLHNINKICRGKIRVRRHHTLGSRWY